MRKQIAGALIWLAHRINAPAVTEYPVQDFEFHIGPFGGDLSSYETAQWRESRGWN